MAPLVFLLLSCAGESGPDLPGVRVDSVGGTVLVESSPGPAQEAALLRRIGTTDVGAEGPGVFGRVSSVTMDSGGAVYVADQNAGEIRVFDHRGVFARVIGRPGEGPGELEDLYSVGWLADTLAALDPGNGRISLFTSDGRSVGQRRWLSYTGPTDFIRLVSIGGSELYAPFPDFDPEVRWTVFLRFRPGVPMPDTVRRRRPVSPEAGVFCRFASGGVGGFPHPYASRVFVVPGPDGSVAVTDGRGPGVALIAGEADTTRIVSVDEERGPVPDEAWAEVESDFDDYIEGRGAECDPDRPVRPATLPSVAGIHFTMEGGLVVERMSLEGTRFDFFAGDGSLAQRVDLPTRDPRVPPTFLDRWILVVERDDLGIQTVALYER